MYDFHGTLSSLIASIAEWRSLRSEKGVVLLWGINVAVQRSRSLLIVVLESDAEVYRSSASSKPAHDVKGDQLSLGFGGGGVGGVLSGRNLPVRQQGLPGRG